jgi:hypothetical protein
MGSTKDSDSDQNLSKITSPMTRLMPKESKFEWGPEQEKAFLELKSKLTQALVLVLPDGVEDLVLYYAASKQGLGCVLMQRGKVVHMRRDN